MRAFYGHRFSDNMTQTPEGFLVCHNVPIARTGWQKYLPRDVGAPDEGEYIQVERSEEEVFSEATIASFEGKPVTDDHPPVDVNTANYAAYTKGVVQNVRRGKEDLSDCILADLVIHDAILISEIETGKREVSCGYDCKFEPNNDGTYRQINILGNHVAVVKNGRAGHRVAIQDEKPKEEKQVKKKENILNRMFSSFCKDADPEEIKEAADAINCVQEEPKEEAKDEGSPLDTILSRLDAIEAKLNAPAENKETSLDALEEELEKKAEDTEEESVTVPSEEIKDEEPEEEKKTTDSAPMLKMIRAMKPIIATLPEEQRKTAADAMAKAVRDAMVVKPSQTANYSDMTKRKATDAAPQQNKAAFGEACKKRNPHCKEAK